MAEKNGGQHPLELLLTVDTQGTLFRDGSYCGTKARHARVAGKIEKTICRYRKSALLKPSVIIPI